MKLHNRVIKASFWSDPDILQWPREKRWFYEGLVQLADDSGCLEESPFAFKLHLFPSPVDSDITIDFIAGWVEELVNEGKLIRYETSGKKCLYLTRFHRHQSLRSPGVPEVPLPQWITYTPARDRVAAKYTILNSYEHHTNAVPCSYQHGTDSVPELYDPQIEREEECRSEGEVDAEVEGVYPQPFVDKSGDNGDDGGGGNPTDKSSNDAAEVWNYYTSNIDPKAGDVEREQLLGWLKQTEPGVILAVIKEAIISNARSLRFINKVLTEAVIADGVRTVEAWERRYCKRELEIANPRGKPRPSPTDSKQAYHEPMPQQYKDMLAWELATL